MPMRYCCKYLVPLLTPMTASQLRTSALDSAAKLTEYTIRKRIKGSSLTTFDTLSCRIPLPLIVVTVVPDPFGVFKQLRVKHKRGYIVHDSHSQSQLSQRGLRQAYEVGPEGFSIGKIPFNGSEGAIVFGMVEYARVKQRVGGTVIDR